jgi:hypothetical protein
MADVTLTITLPDIEAHALAIIAASLGREQFEHAYQHWLSHWKASEAYSPQVEANMTDLMSEGRRESLRGASRRWLRCSHSAGTAMTVPTHRVPMCSSPRFRQDHETSLRSHFWSLPEPQQPLNDCSFVHVAASRFDRAW